MNILDIIEKKRDKKVLTRKEIDYFVREYTNENIPNYQAAALLMAIYINGLNKEEIHNLTLSMKNSGDNIKLQNINSPFADKHSTGGVGDKTTFLVLPIIASCGVFMPKMSGRGLGFTGGTADKIESIPGFRTQLSIDEFENLLYTNKAVLATQTNNLAPADKKIYALRDVTGTVSSLPLIAASIMSKKLAINSDIICLDVKCGSGAFMKTYDEALKLTNLMIEIGIKSNRKMCAVISDMNEPLGNAVGNGLEVIEAIEALKNNSSSDLLILSKTICELILKKANVKNPKELIDEKLSSGEAFEKFCDIIKAQGGDLSFLYDLNSFKKSKYQKVIYSKVKGFVSSIDCELVGKASLKSGAGRNELLEKIDHKAGLYLYKKVGDSVEIGEKVVEIYGESLKKIEEAEKILLKAYKYCDTPPEKRDIVLKIIE